MEYKEFTCLYCGAKGVDRSRNRRRTFCDDQCQQAYFRRKRGMGVRIVTPSCIHNKEIRCFEHKCGSCGWNPKVEAKRKAALV